MILELENDPRPYAWGSTSDLALLEGREPSGRPEAELWFGDHAGSPSRVTAQQGPSQPLDRWVASHGSGVGIDGPLPVLVKLLAAASPLSLQVHPTRGQAREGYEREDALGVAIDAPDRHYRDRQHKPEMIIAIRDGFEALAGLRPGAQTAALLDELGTGSGVTSLRAALAERSEGESLGDVIAWALSGDAAGVVREVCEALHARGDELVSEDLRAVARVERAHPSDPGVVIALMMNRVVLARGQALFVAPRTLHSYLGGLGVEIMAPSDNVLRGGLTPKNVDTSELVRIMDARPASPCVLTPERDANGAARFALPGAPFEVWSVRSAERMPLPGGLPIVVVATSGRFTLVSGAGQASISPGRAALVTPDETEARLSGLGEGFVVMPRQSADEVVS